MMDSFQEAMIVYKEQLEKGFVQKAYRGLMEYMMALRTYFMNRYPESFVSGSLYYGYMDMTYFSFIPESMKDLKLKPAIVFIHEALRFEIWLAATNKQVQANYWKLFKDDGWDKYRLVPDTKGYDAILEHVLVETPDFSDLDNLTRQIEAGTLQFIRDAEAFLLEHKI